MKKRISKRQRKQYNDLRKSIPRYITSMTKKIEPKRLAYIKSIIKAIKGKSISDAKKIIKKANDQSYMTAIYKNLYYTLGMTIAKGQYNILNSRKADEINELEKTWLAELDKFVKTYSGVQIKTISKSLREQLLAKLDGFVKDAVEQGESIEVVTDKIVKDMDGFFTDANKWQARRIAHTETMHAAGKAQEVSVDSLGIEYWKVWNAVFNNTRPSHQAMQGVAVKKGKPFNVNGSKMMFPSDSSMGADVSEIVNCSCFLVFEPIR